MGRKNILQAVMAIAFVILVFVPGLLLVFTGAEEPLSGEERAVLPAFTVDGWVSQDFQSGFETWFSRSYAGRQKVVRAYVSLESLESSADQFRLQPGSIASENDGGSGDVYAVIDELVAARDAYAAPAFPEYAAEVPKVTDQSTFRGTDDNIVGIDGVLFADLYIDEVFGFTYRYSSVTDAELERKAEQLAYIQEQLEARGIAFTVAISPNKAAYYADYIPEFYLAKHTMPEGYERPYTRLLALLKSNGVNHVDSAAVFAENGLVNSFTLTGIHWNDLASAPVAQAIMEDGARQLGVPTRGIITTGVTAVEGRIDYEGFRQDLFKTLYSERPAEREKAIIDPYYYTPEIEVVNPDAEPLDCVWIQGGSFRYDIQNRLMYDAGYMVDLISSDYNDAIFDYNGVMLTNWEDVLSSVSHIIFEVNEQFIYNMGGSRPWEIGEDVKPEDVGDFNIHDALEAYLRDGDNSAFEGK